MTVDPGYRLGDIVETVVCIEEDGGTPLPKGTRAVVSQTPSTNNGYYEIDVNNRLFDVLCREVQPFAFPQDFAWAQALRKQLQGEADGLEALMKSLRVEGNPSDFRPRAFYVAMRLLDVGREEDAALLLEQCGNMRAALQELWTLHDERGKQIQARRVAHKAMLEGILLSPMQRPGVLFKDLTHRPWWNLNDFAWVSHIEELTTVLQDAVDQGTAWEKVGSSHRASGRHDDQVLLQGDWHEEVLFGDGVESTTDAARAIAEILPEAVELARDGLGEIIFSRLAPRTVVAAHCAPTNLRLTCHLGLRVPPTADSQRCAICVGGEWRQWEEGKALIFDDSFEHEVVNETDVARTVLLIRFWHPAIPRGKRKEYSERAVERYDVLEKQRRIPPLRPKVAERMVAPCSVCGDARAPFLVSLDPRNPARFAAKGPCGHIID